jgi:hypothetical protein
VTMPCWPPDWSLCDSALSEWASSHFLTLIKDWQGDSDVVRSVWLEEKQVQIWLEPPDAENFVEVNAARRSDLVKSGWDYSIKFKVPLSRLEEALEVIWNTVKDWR